MAGKSYARPEYAGSPVRLILQYRGTPLAAPRMSRRDVWSPRPVVLRYRKYCDALRTLFLEHPQLPKEFQPTNAQLVVMAGNYINGWREYSKSLPIPEYVQWVAFMPMPTTWSVKKQKEMYGKLHRVRVDRDNIDKAVCDALFAEDGAVAVGRQEKRWVYPGEEQIIIVLHYGSSAESEECHIPGLQGREGNYLKGVPEFVRSSS